MPIGENQKKSGEAIGNEAPQSQRVEADLSEEKKKKDIGAILARNIWVQIFSLIRQFSILPLISPAHFGVLQVIIQLSNYSTLFQGGAVSALNYLFPQFLASQSTDDCRSLQRLTLKVVLLGSLLFVPCFWFALNIQKGVSFGNLTLLTALMLAPVPLLSNYVGASFSVRGQFQTLARIDFFVALYGMVALVFAALAFEINGLILAALTPPLLRVILGKQFFGYMKSPKWPSKKSRENLFYGTKVWLSQAVTTISMTFDIIVLNALVGTLSPLVGLFAAALKIQVLLQQYITALSTVHLHRLLLLIGQKKTQPDVNIHSTVTKNIALECAIASLGSSLLFVCACIFLPIVFPAYQDCLLALLALLLAVVPQRSKKYAKVLLNQAGKTNQTLWLSILQIAFTAAGYWIIYTYTEDHLLGFSVSRLVVLWLISFIEVPIAFGLIQSTRSGFGFLIKLVFASTPTFLLLLAQAYYLNSYGTLAIISLISLPLTYVAYNVFLDGAGTKSIKVFTDILSTWLKKKNSKRS